MKEHVIRFLKNENGQALTEYGLVIVLIAIAVSAAVNSMSSANSSIYSRIETAVSKVSSGTP